MRPFRHFTALVLTGLVAAAVPMLAGSASAADFTDSGTISRAASGGASVTNVHFANSGCTTAAQTQGLDAYAFTLPSGYNVMNTTVTLSTPSTVVHDLSAYVYNSDCTLDRNVQTPATFDLTMRLGDDDTYLVVYTTSGANITVSLTATQSTDTTYHSPGMIARNNGVGQPVTDLHFSFQCPDLPASQGVDGWIYALPAAAQGAGTTIDLTTYPSTATHDFDAFVYNSDCSFDRTESSSTSTDLSITLDSDDAFVSVFSETGANIWVELTATPAA